MLKATFISRVTVKPGWRLVRLVSGDLLGLIIIFSSHLDVDVDVDVDGDVDVDVDADVEGDESFSPAIPVPEASVWQCESVCVSPARYNFPGCVRCSLVSGGARGGQGTVKRDQQ